MNEFFKMHQTLKSDLGGALSEEILKNMQIPREELGLTDLSSTNNKCALFPGRLCQSGGKIKGRGCDNV